MIDPKHDKLSIVRQCRLLSLNRSSYYYLPRPISPFNLELMDKIEAYFDRDNSMGVGLMTATLKREYDINEKRIRRLMRLMCLLPVYQGFKTSIANKNHEKYPYLLNGLKIDRPNQVWCADITYIRIGKGFFYLMGIMDWHSRKILAWEISNSMDASFCVTA